MGIAGPRAIPPHASVRDSKSAHIGRRGVIRRTSRIEVVIESELIDKLCVHEGLGVREVWIFKDARFSIHELGEKGYVARARRPLLPDLDLDALTRHVMISGARLFGRRSPPIWAARATTGTR